MPQTLDVFTEIQMLWVNGSPFAVLLWKITVTSYSRLTRRRPVKPLTRYSTKACFLREQIFSYSVEKKISCFCFWCMLLFHKFLGLIAQQFSSGSKYVWVDILDGYYLQITAETFNHKCLYFLCYFHNLEHSQKLNNWQVIGLINVLYTQLILWTFIEWAKI